MGTTIGGRSYDGSIKSAGTITAADGTFAFTLPGPEGDLIWVDFFWSRTGTSILTLQRKLATTWRDLYRSDGGINGLTLPFSGVNPYKCAVPYRFIVKAADFDVGDTITIEVC